MGVGRATWLGVLLICCSAILPLLAPSYGLLMASLFLFGATQGFTDIAMNTLVTEIEKEDKQHFMSAAHGFFSLGGVLAGLGSFAIAFLGNPALHMGIAIAVVLLVNLIFYKKYIHIVAAPIEKEPFTLKLLKPFLLIGLISFVVMGSEGAIVDWSGLFLREISLAPEVLIGSGFLAFSTTMTLGRFLGDGISSRIGSIKIVILGTIVALLGYMAVMTTYTYLAILGFGLIGLGFSVIIPELFRIGGRVKGVPSSQGVAFIAGTGYVGFLLAPPVLGFIAESVSLKLSFVVLTVCAVLVLLAGLLLHRKN